jgi:hypothetical protein
MNYMQISAPPKNRFDYVKVPYKDKEEDFIRNIVLLLQQRISNLETPALPALWAADKRVEAAVEASKYTPMFLQTAGGPPGTVPNGIFFFELAQS